MELLSCLNLLLEHLQNSHFHLGDGDGDSDGDGDGDGDHLQVCFHQNFLVRLSGLGGSSEARIRATKGQTLDLKEKVN